MIQNQLTQGDLLYHAVHGLCRVDDIAKENQAGKETLRYSLVPKTPNKMKVRFVVRAADIEVSGFHTLISEKKANEILQYLKAGNLSAVCDGNPTWLLAKAILSCSQENLEVKDIKKRQMLERSAKSLVRELAFVLKMTLGQTASNIQKCLGNRTRISPFVLTALAHAGED